MNRHRPEPTVSFPFADSTDSIIALADELGVHPCCGAELGDCRCDEDAELEREVGWDRERCSAIPRLRGPVVRSCGRGAWSRPVDESASFISSGAL